MNKINLKRTIIFGIVFCLAFSMLPNIVLANGGSSVPDVIIGDTTIVDDNICYNSKMCKINETDFILGYARVGGSSPMVRVGRYGTNITWLTIAYEVYAGDLHYIDVTMLNSTDFVVAIDGGGVANSLVRAGRFDGSTITWLTSAVLFDVDYEAEDVRIDKINDTHFILGYISTQAETTRIRVGSFDGSSFSFESPLIGDTQTSKPSITMLDSNTFAFSYRDFESYPNVRIGDINGTWLTSAIQVYTTGTTYDTDITKINSTDFLITHTDSSGSRNMVKVCRYTGSTVEFGSIKTYGSTQMNELSIDMITSTRFIIGADQGSTYYILGDIEDKTITLGNLLSLGSGEDGYFYYPSISVLGLDEGKFVASGYIQTETISIACSYNYSVNNPPELECENPNNTSTGLSISITNLEVTMSDDDGDLMDYMIETNPNIGSSSASSVSNGTFLSAVSSLDYSTTYYWYVNVTDGTDWTNESYYFTTMTMPNVVPDKPTCILPSDNQTDVDLDTTLKVHIIDVDGDNMSVDFYYSNDTLIQHFDNQLNNSDVETSSLSLDYNTTYNWYVVVNDSELQNTSNTFNFTTELEVIIPPLEPSSDLYLKIVIGVILMFLPIIGIYLILKRKILNK